MKKLKRPLAAAVGLGLLVPLAACYPGEPDAGKTQAATQWLIGQQQADGGFEKAGFAGFETSDAIFALAEQSRTQGFYDPDAARQRIQSIVTTGGKNPLDNIDDLVDGATAASVAASAQAAKVVALMAEPLNLDPNDFDPSNDTATPVDLIARIKQYQQLDGSLAYGAQFNGVLYGAIALAEDGEDVPAGLVKQIKDARRTDGSWNYLGNRDAATAGDVDTTALALVALYATGLDTSDPVFRAGAVYLAAQQDDDGSFSGNPNSTALASIALSALHIDVTNAFWRVQYDNPVSGNRAYVSPYTWLNGQQASDGHIASPNDSFGLNTFGTSQAIQALSYQLYLTPAQLNMSYSLAYFLMTDGASGPTKAQAALVAGAIGPNPSIGAARTRAADAAVNSQAGREEAVNELFLQALGHPADPSSLAFYSNELLKRDRPSVLLNLVTSPEFARAHGPSNSAYVDGLYQSVLQRNPDSGGKAHWVQLLNSGTSRASVAQSFTSSTEYRDGSVNDVYNLLLGRDANSNERYFGLGTLNSGRIETIIDQVGGSWEYYELVNAAAMNGADNLAKAAPTFSPQG